jgi:single-stranded-DNA-specific exonuclease
VLPAAPDPGAVRALAAELHLPDTVCRLLCQRGFLDIEPAKQYLRPKLDHLHSPSLMLGMDAAVDRLVRAVRNGEVILLHGDYDVDGISSTTILMRTLGAAGGRVVPFIPRRIEDGYDLTMSGVKAAIDAGASVLVSCDCGTNALTPTVAARDAGIDVIITDHHLPSGPLPEALAVLNPKQPGCTYPDKDLAAAGVAFKLAIALANALGVNENVVYRMLDLVAFATIADVAPLKGENRVLARYGLKVLNDTSNPGLRALRRAAGLDGRPITAGRIGYVLAPRLNAVGRLGHAIRGVELLTTSDESRANALAREFEELNRRRQELDRDTFSRAARHVDGMNLDTTYGVVIAEQGWHPGVVGIVASRLVEEVCRPVVLVALDGAQGRGSGRSIPAFDLHGGLTECRDLLLRYGGHRVAAGISIETRRVDAFSDKFNSVARARLTPDDLVHDLRIDLEIDLADATIDFEALLRHFEPFGPGNATPVLVARGVHLDVPPRIVGQGSAGGSGDPGGHLKLRLAGDAGPPLDAIGWGMASRAAELAPGTPVDVAFRLERDEWNGEVRLQAHLADIRV